MIYKVSTAWIKAINTDSFVSAWTEIVNAVRGSWGDVSFEPLSGIKVKFDVMQSYFYGEFFTDVEGAVELNIPYESINSTKIVVSAISSEEVTEQKTYILGIGKTINITLPSGQKLITIEGKAKRT